MNRRTALFAASIGSFAASLVVATALVAGPIGKYSDSNSAQSDPDQTPEIAVAGGGTPTGAASATTQHTSTVTAPQPSPPVTGAPGAAPTEIPGRETEPGAPTAIPDPCRDAALRDGTGRFILSLADPICIDVVRLAPASVLTETAEGRRVVRDVRAGDFRYVVPVGESPYGPDGCSRNPAFALKLTVTVAGEQTPAGVASIACAPSQTEDGCAPRGDPTGGLLTSGSGPGRACLFWSDRYSRESGFRVEITYNNINRVYAYILPANSTVFQVPDEAGPQSTEPDCKARKDVTLSVAALLPGEPDGPVGSRSIVAECGP